MSLSLKIAAALDANPQPDPSTPVVIDDGSSRLSLSIAANSPVGVSLHHLELAVTHSDHPWSLAELAAWGNRLSSRLSYLLEPLVVLEIDAIENQVEMRSKKPTERGELRSFYEIRIATNGTLRLERLSFDNADRRRTPTLCHFTREVLERLIDDLQISAFA